MLGIGTTDQTSLSNPKAARAARNPRARARARKDLGRAGKMSGGTKVRKSKSPQK